MSKESSNNFNYPVGAESAIAGAEFAIYNKSVDVFLKMLTYLKKQNPNIALEDLFALLSEALNEANEIVLLREPKSN